MSGAATRLAPCFVGLDKRYVTEIDLTATTTTGDPEGEVRRAARRRRSAELDARLDGLRGEVELPIPAASAVKIGGERAYKLAREERRGRDAARAARRSTRSTCSRAATSGVDARRCTSAPARTSARSLEALGGHCRTLRRTAVGPFRVEEADPERLLPAVEALARLAGRGASRVCPARSAGRVLALEAEVVAVKVAHAPGELERRPRAVAIGTFDGVHLRPPRGRAGRRSTPGPLPTVVTFHPHPREVLGNQVALLATLERRLELLAELGVEETLVVEFTPELAALEPAEFADSYLGAIGARAGRRRRRVPLRPRAQRRPRAARAARLRARARPTRRRASRRRGSASSSRRATSARRAPLLGRPVELDGIVVAARRAAARSASRPRTSAPTRRCSSRASASTPAPRSATARRSRSASTRTTAAPSGRIEVFLLDFEATSTASGWSSSSGSACATRRSSRARPR